MADATDETFDTSQVVADTVNGLGLITFVEEESNINVAQPADISLHLRPKEVGQNNIGMPCNHVAERLRNGWLLFCYFFDFSSCHFAPLITM